MRGFIKNTFPIGFNVKTMSADDGRLGLRAESTDIVPIWADRDRILKEDHLEDILLKFGLNWPNSSR